MTAATLQKIDAMAAPRSVLGAAPRELDFAACGAQRAPEKFWFRPGWMGADVGVFAAKGGEGKSTLVQHEATAGALGREYFSPACNPYKSLVWNCEDSHDDLWRRQEAICEHEDIAMDSLQGKLHLVSRRGCENVLMAESRLERMAIKTPLFEELRQQVNDLDIDVLWLDNAAHVFAGNHDDRTQVTAFINELNGLVRGRNFSVWIILHVPRRPDAEYSGSVAWENAARMRWYLGSKSPDHVRDADEEQGPTAVRYLSRRKSNYSALDQVKFTMKKGVLVPDAVNSDHVSGVVSALSDKRADEICIAGFRTLCGMGIRTTDGKTSPDYLPSQIVAKGLACGHTKGDMSRAMNRLMGRGVFRRAAVGQHANRSPKYGLVLATEAE